MIKFILVALGLFLYLVLFIPVMLILLLVRKFRPDVSTSVAQGMVSAVFRLMIFITGSKVEVRGSENIPKDGGVLFVSNHRSYFDILTGFGYTKKPLGFVAKYEMIHVPLLRQDIKQGLKTIIKGIDQVKSGVSVWICPEGGRNMNPDVTNVKEFKEGSLKIAEKGKVPVVPVAIYGTYEIWEEHMPYMRKSKVIIEYGKPIVIDELPDAEKKKLGAYTRSKIVEMLENMAAQNKA